LRGGGRHNGYFYDVINISNLFSAWKEFCRGKRSKSKVAEFELKLEENIFDLRERLERGIWAPDPYKVFFSYDPKLREIHEASVRDRVLYQAIYRVLYQIFDRSFVFHSYSSRNMKGTHLGVRNFDKFLRKVTKNGRSGGHVLKCDVRKFFDSIDHRILLNLIKQRISDQKLLGLLEKIIFSFEKSPGKGLPLGNVTSQLFANIYLNEMDQFIKKELKAKYYGRYCDDFVILDSSIEHLNYYLDRIRNFCQTILLLNLHPNKVEIRKLHLGTDFLGYVSLPNHIVLRTRTKKRMFKKLVRLKSEYERGRISTEKVEQVFNSYIGMLKHCKNEKIKKELKKLFDSFTISTINHKLALCST
jgi:retron-type reverse transcriptase